ncbi:MAG TPA: hypothetical protein VF008_02965 [Niastella sp.]
MKKLLTVIVVILCACLTQGFTIAPNLKNNISGGNATVANSAKWQHSAWVNPWVHVNTLNTQKKTLSNATIALDFVTYDLSHLAKFKLGVNGSIVFDAVASGSTSNGDDYSASAGSTVSLEAEVHPVYGSYVIYIRDETTGQELLYDNNEDWYRFFSWTVVADHTYIVHVITS